MVKIYEYWTSYKGYDGSNQGSHGYTLAENEDEAREIIMKEHREKVSINLIERKVIELSD